MGAAGMSAKLFAERFNAMLNSGVVSLAFMSFYVRRIVGNARGI